MLLGGSSTSCQATEHLRTCRKGREIKMEGGEAEDRDGRGREIGGELKILRQLFRTEKLTLQLVVRYPPLV